MALLIKIAFRNILRHKGKSLIIGIILLFGSWIMTVGNGIISGMDKGMQENIVERFTGHIALISTNQKEDNVFFSPGGKQVSVMGGYLKTKEVLIKEDYIIDHIPIGTGFSMILNEDGEMGFSFLLGVKFEDYQRMFKSNVVAVEGRLLTNGERGILFSESSRTRTYEVQDFWVLPEGVELNASNLSPDALSNIDSLNIKSNVVFMGFSENNTAMDIRASVRGVVKYQYLDSIWGMFNIIDIESFRECFNYVTAADSAVELSESQSNLLSIDEENLDALFSSGSFVQEAKTESVQYDFKALKEETKKKEAADIDSGSYNVVLVKIKDNLDLEKTVQKLNKALSNAQVDARAVTWKSSVGQIADTATFLRSALNVFVLFIFFVAVIVIMNTLSMAAMERVTEIGMMRAVGAKKGFIGNMFFIETAFLSAIFGGGGILLGILTVLILRLSNISAGDNNLVQLIFGGETFQPYLSVGDILTCVIQLAIVTLIAVIYPIRVSQKITPLEAISRD